MLYIQFGDNPQLPDELQRTCPTWHIGELKLYGVYAYSDYAYGVEMVQADGDEIEYILARFSNVPRLSAKRWNYPIRWYGDMAKFIVANL
jgi:hypothetical protein